MINEREQPGGGGGKRPRGGSLLVGLTSRGQTRQHRCELPDGVAARHLKLESWSPKCVRMHLLRLRGHRRARSSPGQSRRSSAPTPALDK